MIRNHVRLKASLQFLPCEIRIMTIPILHIRQWRLRRNPLIGGSRYECVVEAMIDLLRMFDGGFNESFGEDMGGPPCFLHCLPKSLPHCQSHEPPYAGLQPRAHAITSSYALGAPVDLSDRKEYFHWATEMTKKKLARCESAPELDHQCVSVPIAHS